MKGKYIAGLALIVLGSLAGFKGAVDGNQSMINAGIGGVFLGILILTFSPSNNVKYDAFKSIVLPYIESYRRLSEALGLKGKAVYIPPYDNLPKGGVFIPLYEDFEIDLSRFDENTIFVTDVGKAKEMGLLLPPLGEDLMRMYEEYSEMDFAGAGISVVENSSAVLKSLGLVKSISVEERGDKINIYLEGVKVGFCSESCEQVACPVCNSLLLTAAKSLQELVLVEKFRFEDRFVVISLKRLGGIDKWT